MNSISSIEDPEQKTSTGRPVGKPEYYLIGIIICSIIIKVTLFSCSYFRDPSKIYIGDSPTYIRPALALLHTGHFAVNMENPDEPETIRTPGYPLFIAVHYFLFDENPFFIILTQILLSAASIFLTYAIAARLWNPRVGLLASFILFIDIPSLHFSLLILTETLFTFLILSMLYSSVRWIQAGGRKRLWIFIAGLALAWATQVRPISYYLFLLFIPVFLLFARQFKMKARGVVLTLLLFILPGLIFIGGWQLRNYLQTGSGAFSHIVGVDLYLFRAANIVSERDGISVLEAREKIAMDFPDMSDWTSTERSNYYSSIGKKYILEHPGLFLKIQLKGLVRLLFDPGGSRLIEFTGADLGEGYYTNNRMTFTGTKNLKEFLFCQPLILSCDLIALIYLCIVYIYFFWGYGIILFQEKKSRGIHLFFLGVFLYFTILTISPQAYRRFRVPIIPLFSIYAAFGISQSFSRFFRDSSHLRK